jgi:hypothetical protein
MARQLTIKVLWPEGVRFRVRIKVRREPTAGSQNGWPPFAPWAGHRLFRMDF